MSAGFGTGGQLPPIVLPEELRKAAMGDTTTLLQLVEKHLRRLVNKYDEPQVEQPFALNIAGSATVFSQRVDYTNQAHNSLIICVTAGTLNLWLGDYSGLPQGAQPNAGSYAATTTTQLFLTLRGRVYTVINPSTTVTLQATIIPIAL